MSGDDAREGITAVLSIKIAEPQFEGQTKTKLGNGEVKGICDSIIMEGLTSFFEQNPDIAKKIINKSRICCPSKRGSKKSKRIS